MVSQAGGGGQKMRSSRRQLPITKSAHKAAIESDADRAAILATLDMAAERGGAANLDRRHDATLDEAHMVRVGGAPCLAVAAEDIRHLQPWL